MLNNKESKDMFFMNFEKSLDNLEKEATALELLREKVDINTIAKCTKLSIDKLQESIKKL